MKQNGDFIIRVYGIVINDRNEVLLSDEFQLGVRMTKFPGGGLKYGEGTIDGLKREISEECNGQEIDVIRHFYTTDFFQKALFYENRQLISIYYFVKLNGTLKFQISARPFDFEKMENGRQSFRWISIKNLNEADITFPIDKFVVRKLKEIYFDDGKNYWSGFPFPWRSGKI